MTKANECTCPSGDGSLRHPCPAHPASVELAGVGAKLTFINGRPAMCGCQVEYSSGGGEYSDVIYVTLCAKHSGSAILDLVATNRIALTPEYEGQWHADLYLDREIPLAKAEGATPAEAVLALMSAERIDPEQESVEQAGGNERAAFESRAEDAGSDISRDDFGNYVNVYVQTEWEGWQARAALAQPSPVRSSLLINGYQLRAALDFIAPDGTAEQLESEACIEWRQQDADFLEAGLYAFCAEYPEEGGVLLDEEPTTAQPSPLQSEQAEAERPEVVAWSNWKEGTSSHVPFRTLEEAERSVEASEIAATQGGPYKVKRLMTVDQHDRIVGELRAERDGAIKLLRQSVWQKIQLLTQERDAALARVAALESKLAELEKQEPIGWWAQYCETPMRRMVHWGAKGPECTSEEFHPFYAAPFVKAQHRVPGKYDEVLLPFLKSMEHELHANAGKGDRPGWLQMDRKTALLEIYYHLGKLQKATKGNDTAGIVEYAADVANMSMMLVDVCGLLAAAPGKEVGHE